MLKIQFKDNRHEPFWVMEKSFSIGKANKNNLTIDDPSVSLEHAKIVNTADSFILVDLGSEQGTFVNGKRITQKNLICGDSFSLGIVELKIVDPLQDPNISNYWSIIGTSSWLSGQEFRIPGNVDDTITLGRSAQCDLVVAGRHLSRAHAQITINEASLVIKDLGSANGTFVNESKIDSKVVFPGDHVRFDVYAFRVFGPGITLPRSATTSDQTIPDLGQEELENANENWQSKPTSPGNREEHNLYKRRYIQLVLAGIIGVGIIATVTYVIWGISFSTG